MTPMSVCKLEDGTTKMCRLCLAPVRTYTDIVENERISKMLLALTSIQVAADDEISTIICLKCRLNLNLAYTIQQNMLKAEERFREQLQAAKLEIDEMSIKEEVLDTISVEQPLAPTSWDHTCETCGKGFPSKVLLVRHQYNHKRSKCPICSKELTFTNLHRHVQSHSHNPHICDICGVTLKNENNLRQHKFYSHNAARHKCEHCDKVFVKRTTRDSHIRKEHLGEADFVCETCGKKFHSRRSLNTHVKMKHLKLRPYVCDFCNCGFSSNFAMKTHRRQHTNETPYRCEVCGEGFRQKVSLRSHRKSKHNILEPETCRCPVCNKGFASKVAVYTHQKLMHE